MPIQDAFDCASAHILAGLVTFFQPLYRRSKSWQGADCCGAHRCVARSSECSAGLRSEPPIGSLFTRCCVLCFQLTSNLIAHPALRQWTWLNLPFAHLCCSAFIRMQCKKYLLCGQAPDSNFQLQNACFIGRAALRSAHPETHRHRHLRSSRSGLAAAVRSCAQDKIHHAPTISCDRRWQHFGAAAVLAAALHVGVPRSSLTSTCTLLSSSIQSCHQAPDGSNSCCALKCIRSCRVGLPARHCSEGQVSASATLRSGQHKTTAYSQDFAVEVSHIAHMLSHEKYADSCISCAVLLQHPCPLTQT